MPAFVLGFKYDVFISYAHANNAVELDSDKGWITKFHAGGRHRAGAHEDACPSRGATSFFRSGWIGIIRLFDQNLEKFRKRVGSCDALVILYINAPADAVEELALAAREIDKSRVKNPLRIKSVYAGPPPKPNALTFHFNNWLLFDGTQQPGSLAAFWQEIQLRLA